MKGQKISGINVRVKNRNPALVPNERCYAAAILATDKTMARANANKLIGDLPESVMDTGRYDGQWNKVKIHAIVKGNYFYQFRRTDLEQVSMLDLFITHNDNQTD